MREETTESRPLAMTLELELLAWERAMRRFAWRCAGKRGSAPPSLPGARNSHACKRGRW